MLASDGVPVAKNSLADSQQSLSKRCGISIDFIRAIEESRKRPTVAQLAKLVEFFGDSFVSGLEHENEPSIIVSREAIHS